MTGTTNTGYNVTATYSEGGYVDYIITNVSGSQVLLNVYVNGKRIGPENIKLNPGQALTDNRVRLLLSDVFSFTTTGSVDYYVILNNVGTPPSL